MNSYNTMLETLLDMEKERAVKLQQFSYLQVFILFREDIVVSKVVRMHSKDIEDIDELMHTCDKSLINKIINEVLERKDLFSSKKDAFSRNLPAFRERYHV